MLNPEDFYRYIAELCQREKATASRAKQAFEYALNAVQDCEITSGFLCYHHFRPFYSCFIYYFVVCNFPMVLSSLASGCRKVNLPASHPVRLGMALSRAVFSFEILDSSLGEASLDSLPRHGEALDIARKAGDVPVGVWLELSCSGSRKRAGEQFRVLWLQAFDEGVDDVLGKHPEGKVSAEGSSQTSGEVLRSQVISLLVIIPTAFPGAHEGPDQDEAPDAHYKDSAQILQLPLARKASRREQQH